MTTAEAAAATETTPPVCTFEDMHLKVGDRLQIQPPNSGDERYVGRLIGYLDRQGVMVSLPGLGGVRKPLLDGDRLMVRTFTGRGAFGFVCYIDRIVRVPFEYLHLSFPKQVQGLMVRKSTRVKTRFPAKLASATCPQPAEGVITNLSASGMQLQTAAVLGDKGGEVSVDLPLTLYGVTTELKLRGQIRAVTAAKNESGGETFQYGIEFAGLSPDEVLILQGVIHHEIDRNSAGIVA